ncbi:MAG: CPBP family intramembrane metalloprotease [Acidobacteriota bacterium]|nr:CPBP family intramembrane metalloprotease [Acidobacteriota bacterium]MDE2922149.1 CPBP family intramembrane metalloprotease [Acidobacteriota bacterium]MDE3265802.1 CPBP family intramembrane metalloprotease [Acidobacteriota bacterium]
MNRPDENGPAEPRRRGLWWAILAAAMTLPTVASLAYFVWLEGTAWVAPVYLGAKALQFAGPVAALGVLLAAAFGPTRPGRSVALGLATGIAGAALTWLAYAVLFRGGEMAATAAEAVTVKLADFHLDTLGRYIVAALLISFVHSWLEEVYWRAFVYGRLRRLTSSSWSHLVAAIGFAAHHVVVIGVYLGDTSILLLTLMSLPVVFGGVLWSLIYQATGNRLLAPWLSHVCLDLAIMAVGYDLIFAG